MHLLNTAKITLKDTVEKYHQWITPIALLFGFIIDTLTLDRIDLLFENIVMMSYLLVVTLGILLREVLQERQILLKYKERFLLPALSLLIPFAFGGIFSSFFIFYLQSASILSAWPFLLLLLLLLIGTEYYKNYYMVLPIQVGLWYFAIFSFLIFYIPVLIGSMGSTEFLLAGVLSLALAYGFLHLLSKAAPVQFFTNRVKIMLPIILLYILIHGLYFTNIIPPIPLSLKSAEVYYGVERTTAGYSVIKEYQAWYDIKKYFSHTHYYTEGEGVYIFSAIFAPAKLSTIVYHQWQYKNPTTDKWSTVDTISFNISGGRGDGYRGYTKKSAVQDGDWRVRVITQREQVLGVVNFTILESVSKPKLVEITI